MHRRCPSSPYVGVARLPDYRWIINGRGYANVVPVTKSSGSNSNSDKDAHHDPCTSVYGLVYNLTKSDERQLDRNEGVPECYTKEMMTVFLWPSPAATKETGSVDVRHEDLAQKVQALVYIDRQRVDESKPKHEYIYRMNRGIDDAVRLGVPREYVDQCMRRFIPPDKKEEQDGKVQELAIKQAGQFEEEADA